MICLDIIVKSSQVTFIYIALLTIQIVSKHLTVSSIIVIIITIIKLLKKTYQLRFTAYSYFNYFCPPNQSCGATGQEMIYLFCILLFAFFPPRSAIMFVTYNITYNNLQLTVFIAQLFLYLKRLGGGGMISQCKTMLHIFFYCHHNEMKYFREFYPLHSVKLFLIATMPL